MRLESVFTYKAWMRSHKSHWSFGGPRSGHEPSAFHVFAEAVGS